MRLKDKVSLVTGASRGIGRTIAEGLAREGADVALVARTEGDLEETAKNIRAIERKAIVVPVDISDIVSVEKFVKTVLAEFGRIDILVNNAGRQPPIGSLAENDLKEWIHTITVNLFGTFFCVKAALPTMIERRHGKIEIGCHIITVTNDILKKLSLIGKDLSDFSLETVKMFYNDAHQAGYTL